MQIKTIRQRLIRNTVIICSIMVLLLLINVWALTRQRSSHNISESVHSLRRLISNNRTLLDEYALGDTGTDESGVPMRTRIESSVSQTFAQLEETKKLASSEEIHGQLSEIDNAVKEWNDKFKPAVFTLGDQMTRGEINAAEMQSKYQMQNPAGYTKRIDSATNRIEELVDKSNNFSFWISLSLTVIFTIAGICVGCYYAWSTALGITEPLMHLITAAREIGESGDLEQPMDVERDDEIGELANSFSGTMSYVKEMASVSETIANGDLTVEVNPRSKHDTLALAFAAMLNGLRSLVQQTRDAASQVASGSNQVAEASEESAKISVQTSSAIDEVTSTMHEMSINVQNMVKNTQMQASSVSQTSASIDEMVASIQRVADTAKVLLDISNRSREEVQSGIGTMEKTTDGLNRINESISSSAVIIDALGRRADDIGKIVEVIDDISEQTNLLALNAAIEAARAGEHGLGFAVVADEVRKLAEKSAQSTKEISELIQSIQNEARKAVANMDKSTTIVNEGLQLGGDLSAALRKISNVVTEVYKFAQEIGAATNEQSHGSSQIARATARLNEITHEINSSVEEQAGGAQAVVRAMERMRELIQQSTSSSTELAASAEQMSKMARTLLETVDRFTLDGSARRLHGDDDQPARLGGGGKYALPGRL